MIMNVLIDLRGPSGHLLSTIGLKALSHDAVHFNRVPLFDFPTHLYNTVEPQGLKNLWDRMKISSRQV